jgi:predicted transposase YbfD/YdcC
VLLVAVAAVLAGARSLAGIGGWAADLPTWARPRLGIRRRPPSLSTIRRVLTGVDADVLDGVLHAWLAALTPPPPVPATFRTVAVDGKTCRGARDPDGTRVHLFSVVEHDTGVPLGQVHAESKGFEIAAFATVLDRIDLKGVVVTADALHTQKAHARYLHRHCGRYLFIVKRNQPTLHAQLTKLPWRNIPLAHHSEGKGHGRRETRSLQVTAVAAGIGFPHARLAAPIIRTCTDIRTGQTGTETAPRRPRRQGLPAARGPRRANLNVGPRPAPAICTIPSAVEADAHRERHRGPCHTHQQESGDIPGVARAESPQAAGPCKIGARRQSPKPGGCHAEEASGSPATHITLAGPSGPANVMTEREQ